MAAATEHYNRNQDQAGAETTGAGVRLLMSALWGGLQIASPDNGRLFLIAAFAFALLATLWHVTMQNRVVWHFACTSDALLYCLARWCDHLSSLSIRQSWFINGMRSRNRNDAPNGPDFLRDALWFAFRWIAGQQFYTAE